MLGRAGLVLAVGAAMVVAGTGKAQAACDATICVPIFEESVNDWINEGSKTACRVVSGRGTAVGQALEIRACRATGAPDCCSTDTTLIGVRAGSTWVRVRVRHSGSQPGGGPFGCDETHLLVDVGGTDAGAGGASECYSPCIGCPPAEEPCPSAERGPVSGILLSLRQRSPEILHDLAPSGLSPFDIAESAGCFLAERGVG